MGDRGAEQGNAYIVPPRDDLQVVSLADPFVPRITHYTYTANLFIIAPPLCNSSALPPRLSGLETTTRSSHSSYILFYVVVLVTRMYRCQLYRWSL